MNAHTPGPWHRVKPLGAQYWTLGTIREHTARPLPAENEDSDWRLAEAAPDLLEALKNWAACFEALDAIDDPVVTKIRHDFHGKRLAATRAAIAKAERAS